MTDPRFIIFSDGASKKNPGAGGWGAIVADLSAETVRELGAAVPIASNNQMEMMGVIQALKEIASESGTVKVYTDSKYLIKGITEWISSWKKNNWTTSSGTPVKNQAYWHELDSLISSRQEGEHSIAFQYTPGHKGIPGNERVDTIASDFANRLTPTLYTGNLANYQISLKVDPSLLSQDKSRSPKKKSNQKAFSYLSLINNQLQIHRTWAECEARVRGVSGARYKKALSADDEIKIRNQWGY